jgi:uncharacterized protein
MLRLSHFLGWSSLALTLALGHPAAAAANEPVARQITVTGQASVSAAPDMAIINIGVLKIAPTARQALDDNNKAVSSVIAEFKNAGVAGKDIQTANFSVSPKFDYSTKTGGHPKLVGYQVSNTLTVRVRDLASLGKLLDNAVTNGMNSGGSLSFTNSNLDELLSKARQLAVKNAVAKAKELTEAAGVKVGTVLSISDSQPSVPPRPTMRLEMAKQANAVPVEAGENEYSAQVRMTFAIAE